ncbi:MAG: glycosyltransferase family 39 protein, partial [Chloroflexota bacterium]
VEWGLVLLLVIVAILLRIQNLGLNALWLDEIFTSVLSWPDKNYSEVIRGALSTPLPTPPLLYLISNTWMRLFGFSETIIRVPSVIVGGLGIFAMYLAGKSIFNQNVGFTAAVLLVFSNRHLYFSREARYYPYFVVFTILTTLFLLKGLKNNQTKDWVGYTIFTILNTQLFLTTILVTGAQALYVVGLFIYKKFKEKLKFEHGWFKDSRLRSFIISSFYVFLVFSPWMPIFLEGLIGKRGVGAETPRVLNLHSLLSIFNQFGGGSGLLNQILFFSAAFIGIFFGLKKYWREILLFLLTMFVPLGVVRMLGPSHFLNNKYFIFILPIYLLTVSLGINIIVKYIADLFQQKKVSKWVNSILLILVLASTVYIIYPNVMKGLRPKRVGSEWRAMSRVANTILGPDDVFLVYPRNIFLTMDPKPILDIYFDPANSAQESVFNVTTVSGEMGLEAYFDKYEHVLFIYVTELTDSVNFRSRQENMIEISEWLNQYPYTELIYGRYSLVYFGKESKKPELNKIINTTLKKVKQKYSIDK